MFDLDQAANYYRRVHRAEIDLREHMWWPKVPADAQLGHAGVHSPKLNLGDYVAAEAEPPFAVHRSRLGFPWGPLLNTKIGDCGEAMAIHGIEAFHLDALPDPAAPAPVTPPFRDIDAQYLYEKVGGYDPTQTQPDGSNPTDNGTDNDRLVSYWQNTGVMCSKDESVDKIYGTLEVANDPRLNRLAISEFVVLFRAVGLPLTAQGQHIWRIIGDGKTGNSALASWGYHDIPYLSYDSKRYRNVSWGQELLVDDDFDISYSVQGFVVVRKAQRALTGISPAGVNWTRINADLDKLGIPRQ